MHKTSLFSFRAGLAFLFFALILLTSCSHPFIKESIQQRLNGIPCTGVVVYDEHHHLKSCVLSENFRIDSLDLPAGSVLQFREDGKLSMCRLSRPTFIYGHLLPAGSHVFLNCWGEKINFWPAKECNIQGFPIKPCHDGQGSSLYAGGRLKELWLAHDCLIDSVPCSSSGNILKYGWHVMSLGTERRVRLYENGHLQRGMLSADIIRNGRHYKKGELIYLLSDGSPDSLRPH